MRVFKKKDSQIKFLLPKWTWILLISFIDISNYLMQKKINTHIKLGQQLFGTMTSSMLIIVTGADLLKLVHTEYGAAVPSNQSISKFN